MIEQKPTKPCPRCRRWLDHWTGCRICEDTGRVPMTDKEMESVGQTTLGII